MKINPRFLPYLGLLAGVFALSMSSIFIRWAEAPGVVTSFFRMSIASVVMLPLFIKKGLPAIRKLDRRWLVFPLLGGLFIALDHGTWSTSLQYTQVANGTLFNNIAPVWVALFTWIVWKEKLGVVFWIGLALTVIGAAIIFGNGLFSAGQLNVGDAIALLSSLFYASYFLVTQRGRQHLDTLPYIWLAVLTSAILLFCVSQLLGLSLTGYPARTYLVFLAAGVISQVIGYFSIGYALGHVPASLVAPTMVAQPVLTMIVAIPLANEMPQPLAWLGAAAVVAGIYLVNRRPSAAA
jgi:drug/metabolite transporter (DMT)-like permease